MSLTEYIEPTAVRKHFTLLNKLETWLATNLRPCRAAVNLDTKRIYYKDNDGDPHEAARMSDIAGTQYRIVRFGAAGIIESLIYEDATKVIAELANSAGAFLFANSAIGTAFSADQMTAFGMTYDKEFLAIKTLIGGGAQYPYIIGYSYNNRAISFVGYVDAEDTTEPVLHFAGRKRDGVTNVALSDTALFAKFLGGAGYTNLYGDGSIVLHYTGIDHGMTDILPTDAYCKIAPRYASNGLRIIGACEDENTPFEIVGINETDAISVPHIVLIAGKKSGTGYGDIGATGKIISILNNATEAMHIKGSGVAVFTGRIEGGDDIAVLADNKNLELGANGDMLVYYDGANGNIDTDAVAPSDLTIDCGTAKTLVLEVPVYNDANVGGMALRAGATTPPVTQIVDNLGANTGIYGLGFAALDEANGAIEIPHDYKEGTNLSFHVHWGANAAPSDTDYVKWTLTYAIIRNDTTTAPATPIHVETAYDTQYENILSVFDDIVGTNFKIGDQFVFNIKRVAADGAAYAGVAILQTIGFHYQCDTLGSRQIDTK